MNMKLFYECSFLKENWTETDNFVVIQKELQLKKALNNSNHSFSKNKVEYYCKWVKQKNFDINKPTIIIPIKNQINLIKFTISNLLENEIHLLCNIIIIDDRSEDNIEKVALDNNLSFLRVDNKKGFNFSMLNNIAAKICYQMNCKQIILWNSDLWCVNKNNLKKILSKHKKEKCLMSGSKLLYPPRGKSFHTGDTKNIINTFPHMLGEKWRNTVQFGGGYWLFRDNLAYPIHHKRFSKPSNLLVNCDKIETFITGAFQVWQLATFIEMGGLNPSLAKNYQDSDMCLRMLEKSNKMMYFGKDIYFLHDESLSLTSEGKKEDNQLLSDRVLFNKIWKADKILKMVVL